MLISLARAIVQLLREGRPRDSWSRREALIVYLMRHLLRGVVERPVAVQRRVLSEPWRPMPRGIREHRAPLGGRDAWWWTPTDADSSRLILHFHGGGYVVGHPREGRNWLSALAGAVGVPAVSLDYRLCPEHPHPAAQEDGVAAVLELVAGGIAPDHLVLTGDSAGAGVALGVLHRLRDRGEPRVAGAVLGSPVVDLAHDGPCYAENAATDFLLVDLVRAWGALTGAAPDDPSISLVHADPEGLPPLRFLVGEAEIFRDDVLACAESAKSAGVDVRTLVGPDAVHCWYRDGLLPGPDSLDEIAGMVRELLGLDDRT